MIFRRFKQYAAVATVGGSIMVYAALEGPPLVTMALESVAVAGLFGMAQNVLPQDAQEDGREILKDMLRLAAQVEGDDDDALADLEAHGEKLALWLVSKEGRKAGGKLLHCLSASTQKHPETSP
ncbi:hypothetical protein [Pseudovibrio sp. SPO723]|uniref:hypothetical protein n=1 Tax=Nesiotobacter zosterae TaxID=392721 RepID=UPI0029C5D882|nr:hypothetical protein [Pseudovibrio sp. SPO723]MDX5592662.1 hypothetical protein [Pseudovibrio sp. SPO723]